MSDSASDSDSDYEHWPDDATDISVKSTPAPGYDGKNGLREFEYQPATDKYKKEKAAPEPPVMQFVPYAFQPPAQMAPSQSPYMACYPGMPYPGYAVPGPVYYGFPAPAYGAACFPQVCVPLSPAPAEEKPKKASPRKWQGRTKAEVQEDNMKIAAREGAYEARKVEPVGLKEDQMVWVVEGDKDQNLQ